MIKTVKDLKRLLNAYPGIARVWISNDEEGNRIHAIDSEVVLDEMNLVFYPDQSIEMEEIINEDQ